MTTNIAAQMARGAGWMLLIKIVERTLGLISTLIVVRLGTMLLLCLAAGRPAGPEMNLLQRTRTALGGIGGIARPQLTRVMERAR